MKQIEMYIESNKRRLQEMIERRNQMIDGSEKQRLTINIERTDYYIKGLEDAKKYIEEENK